MDKHIDVVEAKDGNFFRFEWNVSEDGTHDFQIMVPETCEMLGILSGALPVIFDEIIEAIDEAHTLYHAKEEIERWLNG